MARLTYEPQRNYRVVIYARMSSNRQNPRSPDQQVHTIRELIRRMGLNWEVVSVYRDDGISGRLNRKRPGFRKMMEDLTSGRVQADLVIVDTFERFSRSEDGDDLRSTLRRAGVLLVTADSGFADPTGMAGRIIGYLDSVRASEASRVKGHDVRRGKLDAIDLGQWPGGPVPFGYRLRNVMRMVNGSEELSHRVLTPDPTEMSIVQFAFRLAAERGWGGDRIAKHLNASDDIPQTVKTPFHGTTVTAWLRNQIYVGVLVWGQNRTDIVNDTRVIEPTDEEDWVRVHDFCEPLVDRECFDRVQATIAARQRTSSAEECPRRPGQGIALKYPLSGLVRCSHCNRSMVASGSAAYTKADGSTNRYVSYGCPGWRSGVCVNNRRVPEDWIRGVLAELIRERILFRVD